MGEKRPVFVGGPLHGQSFPVRDDSFGVQAMDTAAQARETARALAGAGTDGWDPFKHMVTYRLGRYSIDGRDSEYLIWLATVNGEEPTAAQIADAILNDAAKAARIGVAGHTPEVSGG